MRHVFVALVLMCAFAAGWAAAKWRGSAAASADLSVRSRAGGAAAEPESCIDRHAMEANANLVEQVGSYRRRFEGERERAVSASRAAEALANAPSPRLVPTRTEWGRMARDRLIRLRVPCGRWNDQARYESASAVGHTIARAPIAQSARATAAGLSEAEIGALDEAYERALAKTWSTMRRSCESSDAFRTAFEGVVDTPSAAMLISMCERSVLHMGTPSARRAVGYVAEIRAAGGGLERATSDEQRVAFALSTASAVLYDELVSTLGREIATRAADHDVGCLDERVYDVHDPPPREEEVVSGTDESSE